MNTKDKNKNLHEGHRQRLLQQVHNSGLDNMTEVQILEFVLTLFIPRKDTNELAHVLLNEFGSFKNVFDATVADLVKIDGIGERTAKLITLMPVIFFHYRESGYKDKSIYISNLNKAVEFLTDIFDSKVDEEFYIMFLAADGKLLKFEKLSTGNQNEVSISCKDIVDKATKYKPNCILLAHNHPNGYCFPSTDDIATTNKIVKMLMYHQLLVMDHVIIGTNGYYSFSQNNLIESIYENEVKVDSKMANDMKDKIQNVYEKNVWAWSNSTKIDKK